MVWAGRTRITRKTGGRYGGEVRLGDYLVPRHAFFELIGENGHPDLLVHFEVRDGRPQVVDFHVTSKPDGRGVRSVDLGAFNLDNFATNVFQQLAAEIVEESAGIVRAEYRFELDEQSAWRARKVVEDAVKRPARDVTEAELRRVAETYEQHAGGSPRRAVAELLGYSTRTAARRVAQARQAGFLPAASERKA